MRHVVSIVACLGVVAAVSHQIPATADEGPARCSGFTAVCEVEAEASGSDRSTDSRNSRRGSYDKSSRVSDGDAAQAKFDAEWEAHRRGVDEYNRCQAASLTGSGPVAFCRNPPPPPDPLFRVFLDGSGGGQPVPAVTPAQAGAIAVARLKLPTVGPGIGPSPDRNRWKMAAVGYPLWFWAEGPTQVGPVSDSVAGLNVSLRAQVSSLTIRMGDGTTITCDGAGDKWTGSVEPGAKAPNCGHTYTKPSLPKGSYTVAALTNWAVTWTANGQSGVINVPAVQTTQLPVGELQVLVR
jgi:hypothetical protein